MLWPLWHSFCRICIKFGLDFHEFDQDSLLFLIPTPGNLEILSPGLTAGNADSVGYRLSEVSCNRTLVGLLYKTSLDLLDFCGCSRAGSCDGHLENGLEFGCLALLLY